MDMSTIGLASESRSITGTRPALTGFSPRARLTMMSLFTAMIIAFAIMLAAPAQSQAETEPTASAPSLIFQSTNLGFPRAREILSERLPSRATDILTLQDVTVTLGRWVHIVAAVFWVGTHFFLLFVLPRTLPEDSPGRARRILDTYSRASKVIMPAFIILVIAGIGQNMSSSPADPAKMGDLPYGAQYMAIIGAKFLIVAAAAAVGALMSFSILKKLRALVESGDADESAIAKVLRQVKSTSRANFALGLTAILLAAMLPRIHYLMLVGIA